MESGPSCTMLVGGREIRLPLPPGWQIVDTLRPRDEPALEDPAAALRNALATPIGAEPVAPGAWAGLRVVIAVDDVSRPTPVHRFFASVLEWLRVAGVRDEDRLLIPALGIHRDMSAEEVATKVGPANLEGLAWENHQAQDREACVDLGISERGTPVLLNRRLAEADRIVCVGAIEPHLLQGYGGGLKMLLPGLAHRDTIQANHLVGVSPERFNYVGVAPDDSPMRLDLEEAVARLGKPITIINAVLTPRLGIAGFFCGDPVQAHRAGARRVASANLCPTEGLADVAIVSSDPMDADLRQGMKSIGNVEPALREGGLVVALLACRHGIGDLTVPPKSLPNGLLRFILRLIGRKRVLGFVDRVKKDAAVEERFLAHFSMQIVRKLRILVWSPGLPEGTGRRMGIFRQCSNVEALMEAARRAAPRNARVIVVPHGGVTVPQPKNIA